MENKILNENRVIFSRFFFQLKKRLLGVGSEKRGDKKVRKKPFGRDLNKKRK